MPSKKKLRKLKQTKHKIVNTNTQITELQKKSKRHEQAMSLLDQFKHRAGLDGPIGGFHDILMSWVEDGDEKVGNVYIAEVDKRMD